VRDVRAAGLQPKPEVGVQFGAGGDTPAAQLAKEGTLDASWAVRRARRCLEAGAELIMIESEGEGLGLA
jgi:phosphosulfolactate synthase (CoM biosynthesis protein A)